MKEGGRRCSSVCIHLLILLLLRSVVTVNTSKLFLRCAMFLVHSMTTGNS
jgi:hypothetical protein